MFLPEDGIAFVDGGALKLSSDPEGLIDDYDCASIAGYQGGNSGPTMSSYQASNHQEISICNFHVSGSASCGQYLVVLSYDEEPIGGAEFEVLCACAVGGCLEPVNAFAPVSPLLTVVGIVGCIGTAVAVAKTRKKQ